MNNMVTKQGAWASDKSRNNKSTSSSKGSSRASSISNETRSNNKSKN